MVEIPHNTSKTKKAREHWLVTTIYILQIHLNRTNNLQL